MEFDCVDRAAAKSSPEKLAAGQKLFAANCAACHGETGKGDGGMGTGMPYWGSILTGDQIDEIVAYLYTFIEKK